MEVHEILLAAGGILGSLGGAAGIAQAVGTIVSSKSTAKKTDADIESVRDTRADAALNRSIDVLTTRLDKAEAKVEKLQGDHHECMEKHLECERTTATLSGKNSELCERLEVVEKVAQDCEQDRRTLFNEVATIKQQMGNQ